MSGKKMEGDGGSKQRRHLPGNASHQEKLEARRKDKRPGPRP
jgi:hypothetical protein